MDQPQATQSTKKQKLVFWTLFFLPIIFGLCVTGFTFLSPLPLEGWDTERHLLLGKIWISFILPHGGWHAWSPFWFGGFDPYVSYGPLISYLMGLSSLIIPSSLIPKIFAFLLWVGIAPVTYYFLRGFRVDEKTSLITGFFCLFINRFESIGIQSIYYLGLFPNALGTLVSIFLLGALQRRINTQKFSMKDSVLAGGMIALLILCHPLCTYWFVGATLCLLLPYIFSGVMQKNLLKICFTGALALYLSSFWWIASFLNKSNMEKVDPFNVPSFLELFERIKINPGLFIFGLAAIGFFSLFYREKSRPALTVTFLLGWTVLLTTNIFPLPSTISSTQSIRFEGILTWLIVVMASFSIGLLSEILRKIPSLKKSSTVLLLLIAGIAFQNQYNNFKSNLYWVKILPKKSIIKINMVSRYLAGIIKPGEFVLGENNFDATDDFGTPHILNQYLTERVPNYWDLSGGFPEGIKGSLKPFVISRTMDMLKEEDLNYLISRGVCYLVATQYKTKQYLSSFTTLKEIFPTSPAMEDEIHIFKILNETSPLGFPSWIQKNIQNISFKYPGKYEIQFSTPTNLPINLALGITYHPWLFGIANGSTQIDLQPNEINVLTLAQPVPQTSTLRIIYLTPTSARIAGWLSLLGWIGFAFSLILIKQKKNLLN